MSKNISPCYLKYHSYRYFNKNYGNPQISKDLPFAGTGNTPVSAGVNPNDSKMERMLATYFPSAKNSVRPVKTLVALTVNATTLTPETPVKSLFDLQNGTDVTKVSQFTNKEKLFFDNTVVPTPYEYNPTMGTVKYYVNTLIVLLAYLGIDYKNNIEAENKKVSVSEELDSYSILIRN
jgi:hypothetical protein